MTEPQRVGAGVPAGALVPGCIECRRMHRRFTDPRTPNPGAVLYGWATHHLDDHATVPEPRPGCPECDRFQSPPRGVRDTLWRRWARTHYMKCALAPFWQPSP
ncbi:hypothetical protein [Actinacidiphila yeochonensis]|uniref:hypothetical protein n=1 Tax=Actinacidiphila yeochonensis TaxID=89050 RepID=UPI0005695F5A|nr:hypothetical protein [Actinacidiphila yeochonensis]